MARLALLILTAACGSDAPPVDATPEPATVFVESCTTSSPNQNVMTLNFAFVPPATSLVTGQIVKFTLEPSHVLVPDPDAGMTDPGLAVHMGGTGCLRFTAPGTYHFMCGIHTAMKGTVTVQ